MTDYAMKRGDTLKFKVIVKVDNVAVDITGWKVWFTVKESYAVPDAQATHKANSVDNPTTVLLSAPLVGETTLILPPSATVLLPDAAVPLVYDVQVKNTAGEITTVDSGIITVSPDVTRATS